MQLDAGIPKEQRRPQQVHRMADDNESGPSLLSHYLRSASHILSRVVGTVRDEGHAGWNAKLDSLFARHGRGRQWIAGNAAGTDQITGV